ncbi:hydroxyisourate hydrolase [Alkalicoccobacillus gibsonii]|uniref:hydroxyisourate hydrolase n=1 Tax=Alkalicoccobacillus gibsonii TaxID=79881 RepID=UPI0019334D07|nr:hydroxyisourate hydrolase [Alkalicoccobacillus gibsonii]MBM0066136.1 hydroxyisourate hydrolase [Alkalicoccobacillus gibsonii]
MTTVTTHVLDLTRGCPAEGMHVEVYILESKTKKRLISTHQTNVDGRLDQPLLSSEQFIEGEYEIHYATGAYFRHHRLIEEDPHFSEWIVTRVFLATDQAHYHIPLLVSPWGYQVYRGS